MFDKKVIRKCIIIILIIVLIVFAINFIRRAFSRYESDGESGANPSLAFWVVNESLTNEDIMIEEIQPLPINVPDRENYIKNVEFTIQNYKNTLSAQVPLKYEIKLLATTNLPLKYELYQYGDDDVLKATPCIVSDELIKDDYGTVYREIKALPNKSNMNDFFFDKVEGETGKEIDKFLLKVWLPDYENDGYNHIHEVEGYNFNDANDQNYMFADLIDYINVEIKATQIISEEENK